MSVLFSQLCYRFFFFNDTATTEIYTLSLHDALPILTFKWTLLLRAQGYRLPLLQGVMIYCTAMVWGLVLPTTVGADAIRAVMVTKRGFNGTDVVTSIVIERMVGFVLALALGLV